METEKKTKKPVKTTTPKTVEKTIIKSKVKTADAGAKIAAILIRCNARASKQVVDTLTMLRLHKKNTCAVPCGKKSKLVSPRI